jgi:uncharacterized membrane protein
LILAAILRRLRRPIAWAAIYWWNPLLIHETYVAAHMDLVAIPFVLGAVLLSLRQRPAAASALLALATAVKVWPVLLFPVILRPVIGNRGKLAATALGFLAVSAILFAPVLIAGIDRTSGFLVYGHAWQMNDSLHQAIQIVAGNRARVVVLLLAFAVAVLSVRKPESIEAPFRACLWILSAAFLLSPTQFPWYFLWVLPFLALERSQPMLLLTVFLPLYYARFYFEAIRAPELFDHGIVWLEFAPVWAALLVAMWRKWTRLPPLEIRQGIAPRGLPILRDFSWGRAAAAFRGFRVARPRAASCHRHGSPAPSC